MSSPSFFVVGVARSGTTLLRTMLDSHPAVTVPGESHVLPELLRDERDMREVEGRRWFVDLVATHRFLRRWAVSSSALTDALDRADVTTTLDAVDVLYETVRHRAGARVVGDKTPLYVRRLPELGRWFPEARFVHLVRDPRDVAPSWAAVDWGPSTLEEGAARWRTWTTEARAAVPALAGRLLEIRYEDLVGAPEATMRQILDHLGVDWDRAVLAHRETAVDVAATLPHPEDHQRIFEPPSLGRSWQADLEDRDVRLIEQTVGMDHLVAMGYAPSSSTAT